ncbi:hypothetical protein BDY24DRAFT_414059 [Mrakia frigida]|uniref:uncharacterized protein n=1 Tax=Mrakia frigida TaxID=29902 RepID=UPI003FCC0ECF
MAPKSTSAAAKRKPRKRNRRAAASDSDSSSSSDGSSSSDEEAPLVPALQALRDAKGKGKELPGALPTPQPATVDAPLVGYAAVAAAAKARLEEESGSESDSSSSSGASSIRPTAATTTTTNTNPIQVNPHISTRIVRPPRPSTSPSPPPSQIPAFLPFSNGGKPPSFLPPPPSTKAGEGMDGVEETSEEDLKKKKFREFWMGKLVKGFGEDLDVVRQEPTLTTPRLTLLIDSLTSGIDVFSTGSSGKPGDVDERDVVLGKI